MTHPTSPYRDVDLETVENLLRELPTESAPSEEPPSELWDRIVDRLAPSTSAPLVAGPDLPVEGVGAPTAPAVDLDSRRHGFARVLATVAAALVLVVAGAVVFASRSGSDTTVVAVAQLSYDETFDEFGRTAAAGAKLIENDDGSAEIRIVEASLPDTSDESAALELWLIEPDAEGNVADLVSLGLLDPDKPGVHEVPEGYDPTRFFVVDISVEPREGPPTHSGRSILRGPLVSI